MALDYSTTYKTSYMLLITEYKHSSTWVGDGPVDCDAINNTEASSTHMPQLCRVATGT